MATLRAIGPVTVENVSLGKLFEASLVSFEKKVSLVVEINGHNVSLAYDTDGNDYEADHNGHRYRAMNPKFVAE